ncbi:MAG: T9SS type A sorting domain-containing protein [Saprospiraceae bacterium]|nr:T9SS type A sorting domain-containing protein [Saprospiraceae bacterium]
MKCKFPLLVVTLVLSLNASAQSRAVVASAGGESQSSNVHLSWTLGEMSVATVSLAQGELLTEGFQQPDILRVEPVESPSLLPAAGTAPAEAITIAPNPVSTKLNIRIPKTRNQEALTVELFDANARKIRDGRIEPGMSTAEWDMSTQPSGTYWLRIIAPGARQIENFRVIKIK